MRLIGRQRGTIGFVIALWPTAMAAGMLLPAAGDIQVETALTTQNIRTEESNLADLVADAIRAVDKSDVALIPANWFSETTIPKGRVSAADLLKALEFRDDTVVIVKLTGTQIKQALEHGLAIYPQKNAAFLQVSGLSFVGDGSKDEGHRVVSVKVGKSDLEEGKTYTVAMPSRLAKGALAYHKIWDKKNVDHDTNQAVEQAVTDYLKGTKTISGKTEERIVFKK